MRPPLLTAEIHAWNFGREQRALGRNPGALVWDIQELAPLALGQDQVGALLRLGPDLFWHWVRRGFWETGEQ